MGRHNWCILQAEQLARRALTLMGEAAEWFTEMDWVMVANNISQTVSGVAPYIAISRKSVGYRQSVSNTTLRGYSTLQPMIDLFTKRVFVVKHTRVVFLKLLSVAVSFLTTLN
jgi:hypothetical protein